MSAIRDSAMIALDMDCVLADYRSFAVHVAGMNPADFQRLDWELDLVFDNPKSRWRYITDYGRRRFFSNLPPYPWTQQVVRTALAIDENLVFLTGVGREEDAEGKSDWLDAHFSDIPDLDERLICVMPRIDKTMYRTPGMVLVDDRDVNVLTWLESGNPALWFPDVATAEDRRATAAYVAGGGFERDLREQVAFGRALRRRSTREVR